MDISKLKDVLDSIRKSKPLINVYLRADKDAPYGAVVQVMDVVKRAGIDRLGMVTEAAPGGETGSMMLSSGRVLRGTDLSSQDIRSHLRSSILFSCMPPLWASRSLCTSSSFPKVSPSAVRIR